MKNNKLVYALTAVILMTMIAMPAFAQGDKQPAAEQPQAVAQPATTDTAAAASPSATIPPAPATGENVSVKELSIYGEVQSVNASANSLTVQYYDYDSDEEKTIEITADANTKIENAAALGNINKSDWVDVTYTVADGKNLAKSIMVEKEEKEEEKVGAAPDTTSAGMAE